MKKISFIKLWPDEQLVVLGQPEGRLVDGKTLPSGSNLMSKLQNFSSVSDGIVNYARVLNSGMLFQPCLLFMSEAG